MAVAEIAEGPVVAGLLAHVHDGAVARELRQAADRIAIGDVRRIVADQVADHADVQRFGGRHHAQAVVRVLVDLEVVVRVRVAGIPAGGVQILEHRDLEIRARG